MRSRRWLARPKNLSSSGIHSDETARAIGFAGGFVPGVALYELIVSELLDQGLDWLREGSVEFRFRRPVYDGEEVAFAINGEASTFTVSSADGSDERASGRLGITDAPPVVTASAAVTPLFAPLGSPEQIGMPLQISLASDPARAAAVAALPSGFHHMEQGRALYPPSLWINPVDLLKAHFDSPVTVHYAGRVWHHSPAYVGETIVKRGQITGFEERRGNQIVRFTVTIETGDGRPLATIDHHSVYSLARAKEVAR